MGWLSFLRLHFPLLAMQWLSSPFRVSPHRPPSSLAGRVWEANPVHGNHGRWLVLNSFWYFGFYWSAAHHLSCQAVLQELGWGCEDSTNFPLPLTIDLQLTLMAPPCTPRRKPQVLFTVRSLDSIWHKKVFFSLLLDLAITSSPLSEWQYLHLLLLSESFFPSRSTTAFVCLVLVLIFNLLSLIGG